VRYVDKHNTFRVKAGSIATALAGNSALLS
jgi:hypothetical protein